MTTKRLIKLCQRGDSKGFQLLVHQFSPTLMAVCLRYLKDNAKAKDAVQESFISVFKNIGQYRDGGKFESWLKKIAVNNCLKELRKNKHNVMSLTLVTDDSLEEMSEASIAIDQLVVEDVMTVINSLQEDYRIVFNMYVIEGYGYKEIATLLEMTEGNCRMKVSRARKKIHLMLLSNTDYYGYKKSRKVD